MPAALLLIEAPLASWAEGGAHYAPTDRVPTWSALTGMVGAACGWARTDERLLRFARDYAPAIRVVEVGDRLVDYHTVHSPHRTKKMGSPRTRHEELQWVKKDGEPHTTPTRREYLQTARYEVVLIPLTAEPVIGPEAIAEAVMAPVYPLYAGRRSCLLGMVPGRVVRTDELNATATHWDARLAWSRSGSLVRERRDLLVGLQPRRFALRHEVVA